MEKDIARYKSDEPMLSKHLHAMGRKLGLPISGTFEITARCNFSCPMCYVHENASNAEGELTAAQWLRLANEAKELGMVFALITGGEPFIRKDFFEIYSGMKKMGLLISINSNGSLIKGEVLEGLLEDPPFRMNISLYGACKETYRTMCKNDAYEDVLENITALRDAGVDVRLNLSVTQYNCHDAVNIINKAKEMNLHVRASSYMYPPVRLDDDTFGKGNRLDAPESAKYAVDIDGALLSEEDFEKKALNMRRLVATENGECSIDMSDGVGCRAGSSSFWLAWDGKMTPCGMMTEPARYPLDEGFAKAWQGIMESTKRITMPKGCINCPRRQLCGVCAAICFTETGGYEKSPEYMCERTDSIIRYTEEEYQRRQALK